MSKEDSTSERRHTFQLKSGSSPQCGYYDAERGSCHRLASDEIHSFSEAASEKVSTTTAGEGVPERVRMSPETAIAIAAASGELGKYHNTPPDKREGYVEYARVRSDSPSIALCSKCGFCQPMTGQDTCYACANGPAPSPVTVDEAAVRRAAEKIATSPESDTRGTWSINEIAEIISTELKKETQ